MARSSTLRTGDCDVAAEIAEGGRVGSLVLPDGERVPLGEQTIVIGRLPDCDVIVDDPKASRRHAEVRPDRPRLRRHRPRAR